MGAKCLTVLTLTKNVMNLKMNLNNILTLIAIVVIPILAVLVSQWLQNRSEKRKDKMQIFKILMTSRIYGWTPDMVNALNIIDIVFADDKNVRAAWKDLNDKYHISNPDQQHLKKIQDSQYKLLEEIANSLGYKNKITWETIQNPYFPQGLADQIEVKANMQQAYFNALDGVNKAFKQQQNNTQQEVDN